MLELTDEQSKRLVRLLKGAAAVFAVTGLSIAVWLVDKWIRYPHAQARQLDHVAPLWPAATLFVLIATTAGVVLLWKTAQRVKSGEEPFVLPRSGQQQATEPPEGG